jgi:hypothetical protein
MMSRLPWWFRFSDEDESVSVALTSCVVDDCQLRLVGEVVVSKKAEGMNIMNICQSLHLLTSGGQHRSLRIPTPVIPVLNGSAMEMFQSFASWQVLSVLGVGKRFVNLGLNPSLGDGVASTVQCVCDDSFRANAVVFREIRKRVVAQTDCRHMAINFKCNIHLGNLIRKSLVLAIPGYWTTVVRLGHLFELSRFRQQFSKTMSSIIAASFNWVPVASFSTDMKTWYNQSLTALDLWKDEPGQKSSKRYNDLMALIVPCLRSSR